MSKLSFWLVWGVAGVPMLFAMLMYFAGVFLPSEKQHGGELLTAQHIQDWQLQEGIEPRKWGVLLTKQSQCEQSCEDWVHQLRQIHTALGKERQRVVIREVDTSESSLTEQGFTKLGSAVWITDPLGNLVLRYELSEPPKQLLKDLRKLLKVSRIG